MKSKSRRHPGAPSSLRTVLAVTIVAAFVLVDALLIGLAFSQVGKEVEGEAGPIPSFGVESAPQPEPDVPAVAAASQGRYLATVDGTIIWRSTVGSCDGPDAVIEYSRDGGATWNILVTTEMHARQVLSLEVTDADTIWVVARSGDTCSVAGFASFTAGQFWEVRPDAIAQYRFLDRDAPDVVHILGQQAGAPCGEPRQLQSRDGAISVVCDDSLAEWTGAGWQTTEVPGLLSAVPSPGGHTLATWSEEGEGCTGVAISTAPSPLGETATTPLGCIAMNETPMQFTMTRVGSSVLAWIDNGVRVSADGGATW